MLIFTIVPLLFVVYFAFTTRDGAFTTENFGRFFSPGNLPVVFDSFRLAFFCTLICLLIGYPAAYFLSSRDFSRGRAILVLILLPMWMNFLLRTYALMTLLERNGVINTVLEALGLPRQNLIGTEAAVLLLHIHVLGRVVERLYREGLALGELHGRLVEERRPEDILASGRLHLCLLYTSRCV